MTKKELQQHTLLMQRLRNGYAPARKEDLIAQVRMEQNFCEEHMILVGQRTLSPILSWKIRQRLRLSAEEPFTVLGMHVLPFAPRVETIDLSALHCDWVFTPGEMHV